MMRRVAFVAAMTLGAVVAGKWQHPADRGITLFESHGLALWDLAAGSLVVRAARAKGFGEEIQLLSFHTLA